MKKISLMLFSFMMAVSLSAQWSGDPSENTAIESSTNEALIPKIATSPSGISYVAWFSGEGGNYNVRLQKLDVYGNKLWDEAGLLISNHPSMSWLTDWDMCVDHTDHAILTFQDVRNSGNNNIYAYRISSEGTFVWGEDGLELSNSTAFDAAPKVLVTEMNNAVFAWQADEVIILQKISPGGELLFGDDGIVLSSLNTLSWPQLLAVGSDDFILKYFDDSGPFYSPTRLVFAQRYNEEGNPVWSSPATISDAAGISAWTQIFPMVNDGNDGFYIAWHDDRDMNLLSSCFIQHIGADGSVLFIDDGVEVSTLANRNHFYPEISCPGDAQGVYVYWSEMDADQNYRGIYGQKISGDGERLWTDNGKIFVDLVLNDVLINAARSESENSLVFYEINSSIEAMMIDSEGEFVWEGEVIIMSSSATSVVHPDVNELQNGQWIMVWEDDRNGQVDIYGQNIQTDGSLGPVNPAQELTINPMVLYIDEIAPYYLEVENNLDFSVSIDEIFFDHEYCYIANMVNLPYELQPGVILGFDVWPNMPVQHSEDYLEDILHINTEIGNYEVQCFVDEDLFSGQQEQAFVYRISVMPNPFINEADFSFYYSGHQKPLIYIFNRQGALVDLIDEFQCSVNQYKAIWIPQSGIKNGIYFYQIMIGRKTISGKLLKY